MPAPKGNRYSFDALAYCKTPQHRQDAFKAYCEHVAEGHLKESFTWDADDGIGMATYHTIKNLINKYSEELPLNLLAKAEAQNLNKWQSLAYKLCTGEVQGQGFVWINNMHNRFKELGWNISQPKGDDPAALAEQQSKADMIADLAEDINGKDEN